MVFLPLRPGSRGLQPSLYRQIAWFVAGTLIAFLLPFLFSSVLDLTNDVYYAVYFSGAAAFLALYVVETGLDVPGLFARNWRWSLGIGILTAAFLVMGVLQREDATPHPAGLYLAFSIAWRGVLYGVVDALVLTAFPVAVACAIFNDRLDTISRRLGFAVLALALSLTITAVYHLGYKQFREDGVTGPETGNAIISIPAILTTNPLGSVVAHASMHVAADLHAYETDLYLPPRTFVNTDGGGPLEVQLDEADSGRRVELGKGGTLIVALASNPSTGYRWTVLGTLPRTLRQEGDPSFVPAGSTQPVVGAGGTEVFRFKGVEAGAGTLKLGYSRPFETGAPERTFSVEVVTR